MRQFSRILSLGAIALLICSCSTPEKEGQQEEVKRQPEPTASPTADRTKAPPFAGATKPRKPISNEVAVAGLIPSTNPDRRRQEVERGRNDPFALVPVQPTLSQIPSKAVAPKPATAPKPAAAPKTLKQPPVKPYPILPPPLPLPQLAREVVVLGVIEVGGTPQIIVKAPNEEFTRYVQLGQFLANGQVRIKRIEGLGSPDPVVVLEELGQEVYRQVGEGIPEPTGATGKAAAAFLPDLERG